MECTSSIVNFLLQHSQACGVVSQIYTVSEKKRHLTLAHNFTKYWPIFEILSLLDSVGNL